MLEWRSLLHELKSSKHDRIHSTICAICLVLASCALASTQSHMHVVPLKSIWGQMHNTQKSELKVQVPRPMQLFSPCFLRSCRLKQWRPWERKPRAGGLLMHVVAIHAYKLVLLGWDLQQVRVSKRRKCYPQAQGDLSPTTRAATTRPQPHFNKIT